MFILNFKMKTGVLHLFLGIALVSSVLQAQEMVFEEEVYIEEVYDDGEVVYQEEPYHDDGVVYEDDYEEEFYEEPTPVQPAPAPAQPAPTQIRPTRPAPPSTRVPTPSTRGTQPSMQTNGTMGMGTPNVEKSGALPEDYISFDFDDTPLFEVIRTIARLTGRNYDVDPNIGATTVTLITHDMIPPELAYQVLEAILARRGYSMVENVEGHIIEIIPTPDAPTSAKTDLVDGLEYIPAGFDVYSTHIVPIRYADASELANALRLVASGSARIDTYAPTNTLIITDTADGLRRMFRLLEAIDTPGTETEIDIFILEYTRASIIAEQLQQVLLDEGPARAPQAQQVRPQAQPQPQPTRATRPVRPTIPGATQMQVIGSREEVLRIMPDERLNSLIVVASSGMMFKVRDLVRRLDIPTNYEQNTMHIYQLLNADAEQVEQALAPFLGGSGRLQATGGGQGGGGGQQASGDVQPFEQQVQISRYDQTNSLLINASPQDFKILEAFIARLDVPKRQVQVSAVVMDVTINDSYGLSFDAASITGHDGFAVANTRNIAELAQAAQAAQEIVGGPAAALGSAILGLGSDGGITAGMYDDITLNINGQDVKIPFVPLLFQAIETISELEVLSQPTLVSVDNEEASYVVGQEVPFITATSRPSTTTDGQISSQFGTTRVQREEVGVKLLVTPQISEGDNVLLNLEIEVSDLDTDQIGTVDILGPTTNKSLIRNKILVKDGSTAVIAGLIRDSTSRSRNQAPILGDVPILGNLFRRRSSGRLKRNMVVLVTPHIVKEGGDMDRLTQHMVDNYYDANVDELFRRGFFQKVQRKQEIRRNYRPTLEQSEALTGRRSAESFGRGDIQK